MAGNCEGREVLERRGTRLENQQDEGTFLDRMGWRRLVRQKGHTEAHRLEAEAAPILELVYSREYLNSRDWSTPEYR